MFLDPMKLIDTLGKEPDRLNLYKYVCILLKEVIKY